jgi:hypothetical protein
VLQNLILQHASMDIFIRYYLPRRVTADTAAIVHGLEPQYNMMRAICRMIRWIDPDRLQELMLEQSQSVNKHPRLRQLIIQQEKWKRCFKGKATKQSGYRRLGCEIVSERLRQRTALLKQIQKSWDLEYPVNEVEMQLSGLKFSKEVKTTLILADDMPTIQKHMVESMMILPGTTLEEEFCRRSTAVNAVAAYCKFQEGGAVARPCKRSSTGRASPTLAKADLQLVAAAAEKQALSTAMLSVYQEKRPTVCFMCLGEPGLLFNKRVYSFASPGDLSKHFKQKHLANYRIGDRLECKVCQMSLDHKMHLQNHAAKIHGTVS